jgi:hypothetical protein
MRQPYLWVRPSCNKKEQIVYSFPLFFHFNGDVSPPHLHLSLWEKASSPSPLSLWDAISNKRNMTLPSTPTTGQNTSPSSPCQGLNQTSLLDSTDKKRARRQGRFTAIDHPQAHWKSDLPTTPITPTVLAMARQSRTLDELWWVSLLIISSLRFEAGYQKKISQILFERASSVATMCTQRTVAN